ncbi:MAG: hypothetical protein ABJZ55_00605 [Fuerstiella sp.]
MVILLFVLASVCLQELPTGSDVVANYVEAKGGTAALQQVTSYRLLLETRLNGKKTADTEVLQSGNRHFTEHTLPDGSKTSHGTDGKVAWLTDQQGLGYRLKGTSLQEYLRHNTTMHEALAWPTQYAKIECVGTEKIDGSKAYEVHFKPTSGRTVIRYFDVKSGLFIREITQIDEQGQKSISSISDYRRVGGSLVPHKRTVRIGDQVTEYTVLSAESNVVIPEARFAEPKPGP